MARIKAPTDAPYSVTLNLSQQFPILKVPQLHEALAVSRSKDVIALVELHNGDGMVMEQRSSFGLELEPSVVSVINRVVDFNEAVEATKCQQFLSPGQGKTVDFGVFRVSHYFLHRFYQGLLLLQHYFLLALEKIQLYVGLNGPL